MKHLANFMALILLLSVGACSSEEIISDRLIGNYETEISEIEAVIGKLQYEDSRTAVTMGDFSSSSIKLVWAEKDTIGIYPTDGDQLSFPITEGVGTNTCTFNGGGWALKNSTSYKAYSPFNRSYYYHKSNKLPVSILGQKQIGNGNADHLGKYDLQIAAGKTPTTGKISFEFKHQVCFIRMDLTAPRAATWKSITLESDALFTTEATINIASETPSIAATSTANEITLDLENVKTEENEIITAYMVVLPVNLTDKTLNVILTDSNGDDFKTTAVIANDYRNFKSGFARWIKADFFPSKNQIWYTSSDENVIIPDISYLGNIISNTYENGKGIIIFENNITNTSFSFKNSSSLTSITIPNSVTYVGFDSFRGCNNLTNIVIPNSVTNIGPNAFFDCSSLTNITIPNSVTIIQDRAFQNCSSLKKIIIPNKVSIEDYAFVNCSSLESITIPINVTNIGEGAFSGCCSFSSIIVEQGNAVYDSRENCNAIIETETNNLILGCKNTVIPNNVTSIEMYAFYKCNSLTNITIPENVTSIGFDAFWGCSSLSRVNIKAITPPTISIGAFTYCSNDIKFYVPAESIEAYKKADYWKNLNLLSDNQ